MGKKAKGKLQVHKNNDWIVYFCGICIFIISLIIHEKVFSGLKTFDYTQEIINSTNLFTYYKVVYLGVLTAITFVIIGIKAIKGELMLRRDYIAIGVSLVMIGTMISSFFNPLGMILWAGFFMGTNGVFSYLAAFFFLYLLSNIKASERTRLFTLRLCAGFILLTTTIGFFQFYGYDIYNSVFMRRLMLPFGADIGIIDNAKIATAAFSLFAHYNYYSGFCATFFPLMVINAAEGERKADRLVFGLAALALAVGVVTSISQSGVYTLLVVAVLILVFSVTKKNWKGVLSIFGISIIVGVVVAFTSKVQTYRELAPVIISWMKNPLHIVGVIIFLIGIFVFLLLKERFANKKKEITVLMVVMLNIALIVSQIYLVCFVAQNHKHMFTDRGYAWTNTYQLLKENPIIGYGPDNFYYAFPQDSPDAKDFSEGAAYDKPHNMLLKIYMDTGLVGLIGYLTLLIGIQISLIYDSGFYEEGSRGVFLRGALLTIIAYLIQGVVNDSHLTVQPFFFFFMAVVASEGMKMRKSKEKEVIKTT